jgi:maltose/moltooligosaccharide transporter
MKLDWGKTFLIGFGFFGISIMWQIYNLFMPIFLQAGSPEFEMGAETAVVGFGLGAGLAGFIMTLDNIAALFILPVIGVWSDRTRTSIGRRMPYILVGAPLAAMAFALIPVTMGLVPPEASGSIRGAASGPFVFLMIAASVMLLAMAAFRTPVIALMPDLIPSEHRSRANGVINFMGGVGGLVAAFGLSRLFDINIAWPFWAGSVLLLVAILLLFLTIKEPEVGESSEERGGAFGALKEAIALPAEHRRSLIFLMLAIFAWFVGYNAIETFFSSYAVTTLGVTSGSAGLLFGVALLLFILFSIPAGLIGAKVGRRKTIITGLVIFGVLLVAVYFVPTLFGGGATMHMPVLGEVSPAVPVIAIMLAIGGASWALVNINSLPMVVDISEDDRLLGTFTGLYYLSSQFAAIVGPVLNGAIIDLTGLGGGPRNYNIIFFVTPVFFALAVVAMLLVTRGEAHKTEA